jgi:hypothetical protein
VRYDRANELEQELSLEIIELLTKAEREGQVKDERGDEFDPELERLATLRENMQKPQKTLKQRAHERERQERQEHERKVRAREDQKGTHKGPPAKEPDIGPADTEQVNLTDSDSRIMRKGRRSEYIRSTTPKPRSMQKARCSSWEPA